MGIQGINLIAVSAMPMIKKDDDIAEIIVECLNETDVHLLDGDVVVIAQKIISKSEGRTVNLEEVVPSPEALHWAAVTQKDPQHIEVILREANEVVRARLGVIVVEQKIGFICANAGVDRSNVPQEKDDGHIVALLPADPDASARGLRQKFKELTGKTVAVIINDSHGRAFRHGTVGVAIGVAGLQPLDDRRGTHDLFGYELQATIIALADEIAAAGSLLMGQTDEAIPAVVVRGVKYAPHDGSVKELIRERENDMFR